MAAGILRAPNQYSRDSRIGSATKFAPTVRRMGRLAVDCIFKYLSESAFGTATNPCFTQRSATAPPAFLHALWAGSSNLCVRTRGGRKHVYSMRRVSHGSTLHARRAGK